MQINICITIKKTNDKGEKMYKNYVFDLYGTLIDIRTNEKSNYLWKKLCLFYAGHGAHYTVKEMKQSYRRHCEEETAQLSQYDYPEIDITKVFKALFNDKGVEVSDDVVRTTCEFFRVISCKFIKLYDGVIELFQELKARGKKIYLLSNAQESFTMPEINSLGIKDYFDGIIISSEEQCKKPSKNFFEKLVEKYGIDFKESIMIGNDGTSDIEGANKVGMDSLYINTEISPMNENPDDVKATYIIKDGDFRKVITIILKN